MTATCENTFNALNRILTPYRQSMLYQQLANLTLLAFEKDIRAQLTSAVLMERFKMRPQIWKQKLCYIPLRPELLMHVDSSLI